MVYRPTAQSIARAVKIGRFVIPNKKKTFGGSLGCDGVHAMGTYSASKPRSWISGLWAREERKRRDRRIELKYGEQGQKNWRVEGEEMGRKGRDHWAKRTGGSTPPK